MNNQRDYSYYEAHAADVCLDEITSSDENKRILQLLRDGDIHSMSIGGSSYWRNVAISEGDDLGWLGYFIGRSESLQELEVVGFPEDVEKEQRTIHALSDGIARNRSIQNVTVERLSNDGFDAITRSLINLTQLEALTVGISYYRDNNPPNPLNVSVALGNLLESGVRLKILSLDRISRNNIGDAGVVALTRGLRCIGSSLTVLNLCDGSIGSEGLSTLVVALANCTCLERLDLSQNNFSMAAAGLSSLSDWLQTADVTLNKLLLMFCEINDGGLEALTQGAVNNCKEMNLDGNVDIGASGWRFLSTSLQSESCCLERLFLTYTGIGDDEAEILARGLVGNKKLKYLHMFGEDEEHVSITPTVWSAFVEALCNISTVDNTYLSNHTIVELWEGEWDEDIREGLDDEHPMMLYLQLNEEHPQHAARCKILMNHNHLDMAPLLQWELKCLPLAIDWFERAKPCTTLSINGDNEPLVVSRLKNTRVGS